MTDKSWKRVEREIAARLNTTRNPSNGRRQADIDAGIFAIECKKRINMPSWFIRAWSQAVAGVKSNQRPVVILSHAPGPGRPISHYVVMTLDDLVELREQIAQLTAYRQEMLD